MRKRLASWLRALARALDSPRMRRAPRRWQEEECRAAWRRGPRISLAELEALKRNPVAVTYVGGANG